MATKLEELKSAYGANADQSIGVGRKPVRLSTSLPVAAADPKRDGARRSQNAMDIELDRIVRDENQPREEFDQEPLERLAASLKTRGQLQPIRVRWDEGRGVYVVVCGERRWRAARMAGMRAIACVIHEGDVDTRSIQLIENAVREDLKPIEQARAFRQLLDENGWSYERLAAELAITDATVTRCISLLNLPDSVQARVEQGALTPSSAYEVSKLANAADQADLAEAIVEHGLTKAEVVAAVKAVRANRSAPSKKPDPVQIVLSDCTITVKYTKAGAPRTPDAVLKDALKILKSSSAPPANP